MNAKNISCPLCRSEKIVLRRNAGSYHFFCCKICKLDFVSPFPANQKTFDNCSWTKRYTNNFESYIEPCLYSLRQKLQDVENIIGRNVTSFFDVGCGNGLYLYAAQEVGLLSMGNDIDKTNIDFAKSRGLNAFCALIEDIKVDRLFDFIQLKGVLHMVEDVLETLRKVKSLLVPDGVIYIDVPDQGSLFSFVRKVRHKEHYGQLQPPIRNRAFSMKTLYFLADKLDLQIVKKVHFCVGVPKYYPYKTETKCWKSRIIEFLSFFGFHTLIGVYLTNKN